MSAHTSGTWVAEKGGVILGGPLIPFGRGFIQRQIAMALTPAEGVGGDQDANARLIAAAPELLEACKQILRTGYNDWGDRAMLEQAIAKAEEGGR